MSFDPTIVRASLDEHKEDPETLIEIILRQARKLYEQAQQLEKQQKRIRDLEQQQRNNQRTAAPHRIDEAKRVQQPKPPGRRKGHPGFYRKRPARVDQTVEVALPACPHCQGALLQVRPQVQVIEDLPEVRPIVTEVITYTGHCADCGRVRSSHPIQLSQATGAAGTQLGANVLALAAELIYDFGLTRRKVCRLLAQRFGLKVTPGGLVQAAHRLAGRLGPQYEQLKAALRAAAVVHSDETSWYVGTPGGDAKAWLWVFCHREATIYRVERSRARRVITETLGSSFSGVLVSDCLNIYDEATPHQHKCYSHHLKAISEAIKQVQAQGSSTEWLAQVRRLLKTAMVLKSVEADLTGSSYRAYCAALEASADRLLGQARAAPEDQAIRLRLSKQRDHLFEFLYHTGVDATNNLAERQLRPAVIGRKVSCGNRSDRGARTWEVLASLATTARQQGQSLSAWIVQELSGSQPVLLTR